MATNFLIVTMYGTQLDKDVNGTPLAETHMYLKVYSASFALDDRQLVDFIAFGVASDTCTKARAFIKARVQELDFAWFRPKNDTYEYDLQRPVLGPGVHDLSPPGPLR